jgi:UDP-N-acetylglucosamine pyrophosphorylase
LDPALIQEGDLTLLCFELSDPEEPVGRLIGNMIVEYAELTPEQRERERLANAGLYAFSLPFMSRLADREFPIHRVWRSSAWKREKFIVDALAFAKDIRAIPVPREQYYAALKEKSSIPEIERLLLEREGRL